jgi:hypothetical protein
MQRIGIAGDRLEARRRQYAPGLAGTAEDFDQRPALARVSTNLDAVDARQHVRRQGDVRCVVDDQLAIVEHEHPVGETQGQTGRAG